MRNPLVWIVLFWTLVLMIGPAGGGRAPTVPPEQVSILCEPFKKEAYHHRVHRSIWSSESFLERIPEHDSVTCGKIAN